MRPECFTKRLTWTRRGWGTRGRAAAADLVWVASSCNVDLRTPGRRTERWTRTTCSWTTEEDNSGQTGPNDGGASRLGQIFDPNGSSVKPCWPIVTSNVQHVGFFLMIIIWWTCCMFQSLLLDWKSHGRQTELKYFSFPSSSTFSTH